MQWAEPVTGSSAMPTAGAKKREKEGVAAASASAFGHAVRTRDARRTLRPALRVGATPWAGLSGLLIRRDRSGGTSPAKSLERIGAPGEIRTHDLWLRRPALYPTELRAHAASASP